VRVDRKLAEGRHSNDELGREVDACRKVLESDGGVAVGRFGGALDLPLIKKLA
jgi:hypothetical protein